MSKTYISKEEYWIRKKIQAGQSQEDLIRCVGSFSNKKKDLVMKIKRINDAEYNKRYSFLARVYDLLTSGKRYG